MAPTEGIGPRRKTDVGPGMLGQSIVLPTPTQATTAAVADISAPSAQTAGQPLLDHASPASHAIAPAPANLPNM